MDNLGTVWHSINTPILQEALTSSAEELPMKRAAFALAIGSAAISAFCLAGSATASAPPPEVKKLGYYVGRWEGHGQTGAGAVGNLSSHMTCDWFTGGFQIICKGEERGPTGKRAFLNIISYNKETKDYSEYSISDSGETEHDVGGKFIGSTLTFVINQNADGKPARVRFTEDHISPTLMSYRAEMSVNHQPWTLMGQGRIVKLR